MGGIEDDQRPLGLGPEQFEQVVKQSVTRLLKPSRPPLSPKDAGGVQQVVAVNDDHDPGSWYFIRPATIVATARPVRVQS